MSAWLAAVKAQLASVATSIVPAIQKQYPGLGVKARYALIGYRDVGDAPRFEEQDFTEDLGLMQQRVRRERRERGRAGKQTGLVGEGG